MCKKAPRSISFFVLPPLSRDYELCDLEFRVLFSQAVRLMVLREDKRYEELERKGIDGYRLR
jgi:hypothetical protein